MSRVKERIELLRRTGGALPPEAPPPPPVVAGMSSRARRYAGSDADLQVQPAAAPAVARTDPSARATAAPAPTTAERPIPVATAAPASSTRPAPPVAAQPNRRERFGASRPELQVPQQERPGGSGLHTGARLGPAPAPGEESEHHRLTLLHCLHMWNLTPGRACDRELVLHAAAWYERNEPWALGGLHALVEGALDAICDQASEVPAAAATSMPAPVEHIASNEPRVDIEEEPRSARQRYTRQRG